MKLLKAILTVGGMTGLSRIAGFARDILMAAVLGAGPVADAFFVALKLPNFFRRVTAEGAFSVSFVPVYSEVLEKEGPQAAYRFAGRAMSIMGLLLLAASVLAIWGMPFLIMLIAPGFGADGARFDLAVELTRITFPYLLLMSLSALLGGVLNASGRFAPFAFAPVLFNLCLIAALLMSPQGGSSTGHFLAWGIVVSGALQLLWLYLCVRRYRLKIFFQKPVFSEKIRRVFRLMGPGVIGAGVMHINLFVDLIIASLLSAGSISYLYYADRLNQLPLGIVGIAVGTALLPMLSQALARGDAQEGRHLFNRALEICLFFALPASVALLVVPEPIIRVLFERGAFTAADSAVTAAVLRGYAIGMPAYVCVKVLSSAFWARQDTLTPVKVSVVSTVLNIALALVLIRPLGVAGIALATAIAGWVQFALLRFRLRALPAAAADSRFLHALPRFVLAACIMGGSLFIYDRVLMERLFYDQPFYSILALAGLVLTGVAAYGGSVLAGGAISFSDIKTTLHRKTKI